MPPLRWLVFVFIVLAIAGPTKSCTGWNDSSLLSAVVRYIDRH
jgi:hypothetical protein